MVIQEFADPVPYVVVDKFLGTKLNQQILQTIENHLPQFASGEIQNNKGTSEVNTKYKRNGNIWLDSFNSDIVSIFRNYFFRFDIKHPELNHTNKMHEVLLSQYVDGDFYEWHTDLGGSVTWNYFAFQEPKQFSGGEFCLSNAVNDSTVRENVATIEPRNDRLIIFPAKYQHQVNKVQALWTEPMFNRYTIQVFFR